MLDAFAAGFLVFAYVATALFQIAIVLGAPLGEYAYGGQNPGILKLPFRIASVFSALVMFAIAGHYLAQLGSLRRSWTPQGTQSLTGASRSLRGLAPLRTT
jgi:predicted cobalt transporter CbtA